MDIVTVFRRTARRHPDRSFVSDPGGGVTYGEADARTEAIAADLAARGVSPGDPIGLCSPDRTSLWLAIIGAWKAGAMPSLIDPRTADADLPYFVGDISAKLVAAPPDLHHRLRAAGALEVVDLEALGADAPGAGTPREAHGPDSPLYLSYTSGTTGVPKGAVLHSGPVTLGTACIAERLGLTSADILLVTTPASSSFQLVAAVMPAVHVGASVVLAAGSGTEEAWAAAREARASVLVAYPLTLSDIVNAPQAGEGDSPFRLALSGGSPLAPRIKRDYRERLGIHLLESYGQSELGGFMALGSVNDGDRAMAGFVGRPLPDRLAYVGGPDGAELPAGEVGEVLVPEGYFAGYWNKPDRTAEALAGGVLHTGDLGVSDPDGYLKVLGRTREGEGARRRGGFLREAEDALYEHPAVQHAAVVECQSDGQVEAFVELRVGHRAEVAELAELAAAQLAEGLLPRRITVLDRMPRTFSGKANRLKLASECRG
jgi:acyl-CoA synthetase (AMP-forming)/AMP-acid ligase II